MSSKNTESKKPEICQVLMYGEFMVTGSRKVRCSLILTETELTVQKISPALGGRGKVVYYLSDCVGCRAYRSHDSTDVGAYFSAYFYPLRTRWMRYGVARQRVEQCFRVAPDQNPSVNLQEAQRWSRAIRDRVLHQRQQKTGAIQVEVKRPLMFLILLNPHSGKGHAHALFNGNVQGMLQDAGIQHTLIITERQNHARELVREADLSQWDALVIMSGDGLLFEVVNGLMEREDWEEAIQTPLGVLPGGSGNALAASIHHYSGLQAVSSEELLISCGFILCKGLVSQLDLTSVCLASSQRLFSFLSLAWGFVADVDIESEKYRHVGAARFTVGTMVRLASPRVYRGKLAYLPIEDPMSQPSLVDSTATFRHRLPQSNSDSCCPLNDLFGHTLQNSSNSNNTPKSKQSNPSPLSVFGPTDFLLNPLNQPVPGHWTVVQDEDFVLVVAMYQSHLAKDMLAAPASRLDDGIIHLIYVKAGISRRSLLRLFLAMENGGHLNTNCPHVVYVKVKALRLEPYSPKGIITVDGELVDYGPVQAQIHGSLARLIAG
ncbi:sphingosine kinase 1-like [Sinocyclocheilus grahami]|uniref:sphingosine kinase 1-like n=1 Tax=Sinocyclocheilus grahami TaxID=75366 RepID=UPI0007ACAA9F|nr:PREDICTED: sphingosine kinase 1-like [Sinocyclocheilus grahami]